MKTDSAEELSGCSGQVVKTKLNLRDNHHGLKSCRNIGCCIIGLRSDELDTGAGRPSRVVVEIMDEGLDSTSSAGKEERGDFQYGKGEHQMVEVPNSKRMDSLGVGQMSSNFGKHRFPDTKAMDKALKTNEDECLIQHLNVKCTNR
ncbi:hypothetical protein TNCT_91081 [Trichonephila clavata]|uniref:Uncharacterized protein n=1 Tax=Trichonephila clavata TaxID=2740835 RepID=A0A8X6KYC9_TRICU|nr:hypothetical protein TNCT_91081 [Trichonephila clavata]